MDSETAAQVAPQQSPEDVLLDCLADYTRAVHEREAFEELHERLLAEYKGLQEVIADRDLKLKTLARSYGPCSNALFTVSVQQKARRWYDVDYILEHAPYVRQIPGVVVQTVDRAKIEALAKVQAIDPDVCKAALREEQLTPAVTIKRKG